MQKQLNSYHKPQTNCDKSNQLGSAHICINLNLTAIEGNQLGSAHVFNSIFDSFLACAA